MTFLGKITVYVLFLNLFLTRNNWNKYPKFIAIFILTASATQSVSDSLLENVEQVKKYEEFFRLLGQIAQDTLGLPATRNRYWRVHILRSRSDFNEYMVIDPELSSTPVGTPMPASPIPHDTPEVSPHPSRSAFFSSWRINFPSKTLSEGPAFHKINNSTFKQLGPSHNPFTFTPNDDIVLSVRMRVQKQNSEEAKPKQRTFILVPNDHASTLHQRRKPNQTFFCHFINSQTSTCEICVEFETLDDEKSIHDLRTASHFYDYSKAFSSQTERELSSSSFGYSLLDEDYQDFLEVFERNVKGEFLNVQDGISVDVSERYKTIGHAHARVIGRGQFSVVFALDNVLSGLALRRFPGYMDRKDADNFLLTHEAALTLYKELGVNLEPTRLLRVKAREGYTIYMIQRRLRKDELAENFIEGLLDYGPEKVAMSIKSQGSTGEVHDMGYAEAVSRILHAVIAAIYNNLEKLGNEDCAHRICCDAKPDNFGVGFSFRKEWKRNDLYLRDVITQADLTDFHPCSLVLFDQLLFDGGPEAAMLTHILGYNPYQVYQEKIKNWADAKKLIVKSLANIAYHADDMAHEIMPELVDRTRQMLLDEWQSNPALNKRYMDYLNPGQSQSDHSKQLPLDRLFFDPDEISAESIIQYRNNSSRNNLKLKLHHYLLKLAREMRPDQFHHQLYLPVDYQQDWWLRVVDNQFRHRFADALENRFSEISIMHAPDTEPNKAASNSLKALVDSVATDRALMDEAKLRRLLNWHVEAGKIPDHAAEQKKKHERELKSIERDHLIRRVNRFYSSRLRSLHQNPWPKLSDDELFEAHPADAIEIYEESLETFKTGFNKVQQLFWFYLVHQHNPELSEEQQKQLVEIREDNWTAIVNLKYSEKIKRTLDKALGQKPFGEKVSLLSSDTLLELLTREILSDDSIPLFANEKTAPRHQNAEEMSSDELDTTPPPQTRRKRSSVSFGHQTSHIELTTPSPGSELLQTGYSSGTLTRKSLTELLKKWGIIPMHIVQAEATTFPEAYSKLRSQSWAKALDNLNNLFPLAAIYPLPETVRLRFRARLYERQHLARELSLIPSHDEVQFPSYSQRDTLVQAIKEVMEHKNTSRESKPLVIIDLSSSVDEMIAGVAYRTSPPPSTPRIILIHSNLSQGTQGEFSRVEQRSITKEELNQWISENRNYDYMLRVLRIHNEDQWFTLRLPESVKTKKEKRNSTPDSQELLDEPSSSQTSLDAPPPKRVKLDNLPLSPQELNELEQQGVRDMSLEELTRLRTGQASTQMTLNQAEQQAIRALRLQWCQLVPVAADHFCMYNSLVHLLNMRPQSARKLITHITALLSYLLQKMPYSDQGIHGHIVGGLYRNIIVLALKNPSIRNHLILQLSHLIPNTSHYTLALFKRLLSDLLGHLLYQLPRNYHNILENIDQMGADELWAILQQMINNAGNNTAIDLLVANMINQMSALAGATQHLQLINDLVQELGHQWQLNDPMLTPHMLFLGLGAQALNNLLNNPTQAGFQMLQGFMPFQPGQHMWGDNNMIEQMLMPLLQAAQTPLNVMIVAPAIHTPHNPLGAMFIPAMAGNPALGVVPQPTNEHQQIMQWLNDPDTLTLFHCNQQAPLLPQNMMNAGTHWQPVVPIQQQPPAPQAQVVPQPQAETTAIGQPVPQPVTIKVEPASPLPQASAVDFPSANNEVEISIDNLPSDSGSLMTQLPPISMIELQKLLKPDPDQTEAELEAFSQCIEQATGVPCTRLEARYWLRWLVIIMILVLSNQVSS